LDGWHGRRQSGCNNTADVTTLLPAVEQLRTRFGFRPAFVATDPPSEVAGYGAQVAA
jgi:hypothetical protein